MNMTKLFNGLSRQRAVTNTHLSNDFHKRVGISYWQRLGRFYSFRKVYSFFKTKYKIFTLMGTKNV
ncbi:hypothetical protein NIES19_37640 [Anabaena cylindrica PCC 7122]|nr:hypothetical protein NIES19_37640 [Anabaena cylindrica PCC 7122]